MHLLASDAAVLTARGCSGLSCGESPPARPKRRTPVCNVRPLRSHFGLLAPRAAARDANHSASVRLPGEQRPGGSQTDAYGGRTSGPNTSVMLRLKEESAERRNITHVLRPDSWGVAPPNPPGTRCGIHAALLPRLLLGGRALQTRPALARVLPLLRRVMPLARASTPGNRRNNVPRSGPAPPVPLGSGYGDRAGPTRSSPRGARLAVASRSPGA